MKLEKTMVEKAINKDKESFSEIYKLFYKDMYRFACFMLGNTNDAEDIVSEAIVDIYLEIDKLLNPEAFKSWAFRIIANKCKRHIMKKKNIFVELEDDLTGIFDESTADEDELIDAKAAFRTLTHEEKMIISYNIFGGYKSDEIGSMMNLNSNTVRSKLSRALLKMKNQMEAI